MFPIEHCNFDRNLWRQTFNMLWWIQPGSFEICASKYISAAPLLRTLLHVLRFKMKRPVSGAKTRVQYVTLAHFCYVYIGTYCCVCITLLQLRIAVVHNSNIRGESLKVNGLSFLETSPTPNSKYDAGQKLNTCSFALKFKILVQKMPLYEFLSHIYRPVIW